MPWLKIRAVAWISLGVVAGLSACQQSVTPPQVTPSLRPTPLPQDPIVQVFFNHAETAAYTDPYRQQSRSGDNLEQLMIEAIQSAQSTVDIAVQEFRLPRIAQALVDRQKAGVKIRVILENTYSRPWSRLGPAERSPTNQRERDRYQEYEKLADQNRDGQLSPTEIEQGDALVILQNGQVAWVDDTADGSAGSNLMHHKFIVIDRKRAIVTSANMTLSDLHGDFRSPRSTGNANNLLRIESWEVAEALTEEFDLMWGDGPGGKPDSRFGTHKPVRPPRQFTFGDTKITLQFSPTSRQIAWDQSTNGLIARTLGTATHEVNLALFVFSDQRLANVLAPRHNQGVQIRALIDPGFAYRPYSEALDLMGLSLISTGRQAQCQTEAENQPWQNPITTVGVPRLARGDLLHHKFGLVDDRIVITGSHNWTEAANQGNDETLLVIESQSVAAHFRREFERLYATATLGLPPALQRRARAQQQRCQGSIASSVESESDQETE